MLKAVGRREEEKGRREGELGQAKPELEGRDSVWDRITVKIMRDIRDIQKERRSCPHYTGGEELMRALLRNDNSVPISQKVEQMKWTTILEDWVDETYARDMRKVTSKQSPRAGVCRWSDESVVTKGSDTRRSALISLCAVADSLRINLPKAASSLNFSPFLLVFR